MDDRIRNLLRSGEYPLGKHPFYSQYGERMGQEAWDHYSGNVDRHLPGMGDQQRMMQAMQLFQQIVEIEFEHRLELEAAAVRIVSKVWGIPESQLDARLGPMEMGEGEDEAVEDNDLPIDPSEDDVPHIQQRVLMNTLTQGAAVHQYESLHHLAADVLEAIDPELTDKYSKLVHGSLTGYWMYDILMMASTLSQNQAAGSASVEWEEDSEDEEGNPIVVARALCFPVLLQELSKGVMEIITAKQFEDKDPMLQSNIIQHADKIEYEPWMIMMGPAVWRRFLSVLKHSNINNDQIPVIISTLSGLEPRQAMAVVKAVMDDDDHASEVLRSLLPSLGESVAAPEAPPAEPKTKPRTPAKPAPKVPNPFRPKKPAKDPKPKFKVDKPKPKPKPRPKNGEWTPDDIAGLVGDL